MIHHRALGAQVLQIQPTPGDSPLFYVSSSAGQSSADVVDPTLCLQPVRGGVPVLFPQFADRGPLRKHGFARDLSWRLQHDRVTSAGAELAYTLEILPHAAGITPSWPHTAVLTLQVLAQAQQVRFELQITNTGQQAFSFTGGLHPYFYVEQLSACEMHGLDGLAFEDRYPAAGWQSLSRANAEGEPLERLYASAPAITVKAGGRTLSLRAQGFTQWMVWNPGRALAAQMPDLPAGDWNRFVCIEPVVVDHPITLEPREVFMGRLEINW
jgi:glucose-6-phosphate 1-epimerase